MLNADKVKIFLSSIEQSETILIIQAENPDGDSMGTSLALAEILENQSKKVVQFLNVEVPIYLKYLKGWEEVTNEFPHKFDMAIIVDCAEASLLSKTFMLENAILLRSKPVFILDHHNEKINMPMDTISLIDDQASASGMLVYEIFRDKLTKEIGRNILASILSDTLGLTLPFVKGDDFRVVASLLDLGVSVSELDNARRDLMRRPALITKYKGELLQRVEYLQDGRVAIVHIPWEEIEKYSGIYNPSVLVLEDLRLTEGVGVIVAIKTYRNGKITAKLRANPGYEVMDKLAQRFGCGGHAGAAGIKVEPGLYSFEEFKKQLLDELSELITI